MNKAFHIWTVPTVKQLKEDYENTPEGKAYADEKAKAYVTLLTRIKEQAETLVKKGFTYFEEPISYIDSDSELISNITRHLQEKGYIVNVGLAIGVGRYLAITAPYK